jgi:hypothetical protein
MKCILKKPTTRKQEIAFKANKKSKNKQVVVDSSSEEEEEDEENSSECDAEDMALFMKKFKKYIKKKKFSKGDKKFKSTTKRTCYNCGKHGHFIANCPFEHRDNDDDDDKKKSKPYKKDKSYKRSDKPYKKKSYGALVKNGSPMMRAPTLIVMVWQPLLSRGKVKTKDLSSPKASSSSQSSIKGRTYASLRMRVSVR